MFPTAPPIPPFGGSVTGPAAGFGNAAQHFGPGIGNAAQHFGQGIGNAPQHFGPGIGNAPQHFGPGIGNAAQHFGPWLGHGPGGGPGWLFLLVPLLWIGVIALIIALVARRRRRFWAANGGRPAAWAGPWGGFAPGAAASGVASPTADAEHTLAERFARGDIDEVEYRARLEVLQASRPTPPAGPAEPTKS